LTFQLSSRYLDLVLLVLVSTARKIKSAPLLDQ